MDKDKNAKIVADNLLKIPISSLKLNDFLKASIFGSIDISLDGVGFKNGIHLVVSFINKNDPYLHFSYAILQPNGEYKDFEYKVNLVATPCKYGGVRHWFICPLSIGGCGRQVAVLYKGNDYFGCFRCFNLTYKSRNQSGPFKRFGVVDGLLLSPAMWDPRWWTYRGKPTKRFLKFDKKQKKAQALLDAFNERGDAGLKRTEEKVGKLMAKINGSSENKTPDGV